MTFRTLAPKSKMNFGKFASYTVADLLIMEKFGYLIWVYYNCSHISFNEDLMAVLRIPDDMCIVKPGTDETGLMADKVKKHYFDVEHTINRPALQKAIDTGDWATYHRIMGTRKANGMQMFNRIRREKGFKVAMHSTKGQRMFKNHGHTL